MADICILAADRARARLFSLDKGAPHMIEIADFVNPEARTPGHEREHAPPPRVHDRFGEGRHAIEAHTSPREKAALQFAAMLGSHLKRAHDEQRYRELVLIAPPGFLGALNAALGARLCETVLLRVSKDLTRSPANEIREALPHALFKHRTFANG
ncbi:MAG TPA: host attachment protein [Rhodanobacteraceae bacterium]|nr:host attachment protein [Rhodanobacteraceae bacterium]